MGVSTHVLDTALGRPAAGVAVRLDGPSGSSVAAVTDADGRVPSLAPVPLESGEYRLLFDTAGYFAASGRRAFYPEVLVTFTIDDPAEHYHVPLLLAPFAYSTYRGS